MATLTCSNCQTESAEGTQFCPACGAALSAPVTGAAVAAGATPPPAASPAAAPPGATPPSAAPPAASASQIKFDADQLARTDRIVGIASFVLLISLFLPWFSVSLGALGSASGSGLDAHGYLYVVLILTILIVAAFVFKALGLLKLPGSSPLSVEQFLLIASAINVVLVILAFVFKPSGFGVVSVGWAWGSFVGLIAAIVAVVPVAAPAIRARRAR